MLILGLYTGIISLVSAVLYVAVNNLEPNRRVSARGGLRHCIFTDVDGYTLI